MVIKVVTNLPREPKGGLTPQRVRSITDPGRYGDGYGSFGLSLLVRIGKTGRINKSWNQRLPVEAGRTEIGLGAFPAVSLHAARQKAFENWQMAKAGENVLAARLPTPTVSQGFDAVIAMRSPGWRGDTTEKTWRRYQRRCESMLAMPVSRVTTADVLKILTPIWHTIPTEAARVRVALGAVMEWAINEGHRSDNPALPSITKNLGKQRPTRHHPSVRYTQLGEVLAKVRDAEVYWAIKACLLFLTFTVARSKQARHATWDEIDFDTKTWTIPGHRMKSGIPHTVPLSSQAIDILIYVQDRTGCTEGIIFPPDTEAGYLHAKDLSDLLHSVGSPAVPHGMRSSFRNWAGRTPSISHDVAEAALAHSHEQVVASYLTDDYVEDRIEPMQLWGDFLTETMGHAAPQDAETPDLSALSEAVNQLLSKNPRDQNLDETTGPVISTEDQGSEMDTDATNLDCPTEAGRQISFDQQLAFDKTA